MCQDLEAPPTPHSSESDSKEEAVEEALELPTASAVQDGAVFFKRTAKMTAPDEVKMGAKASQQHRWRFLGGNAQVRPENT